MILELAVGNCLRIMKASCKWTKWKRALTKPDVRVDYACKPTVTYIHLKASAESDTMVLSGMLKQPTSEEKLV